MNEPAQANYKLAKVLFAAFVLTVLASRVVVYLIMIHQLPTMYLYVRGNHIHHLNYGIFLLAAVGGYSLFGSPVGQGRQLTAALYGIGLGLTFDEFGMWLHLGGSYWQPASWDAVGVLATLLALIAFAPPMLRSQARQPRAGRS
jgi:hypothetical protein